MKGKSNSTKKSCFTAPSKPQAEDYTFLLRPLNPECFYYEDITLSLKPEYNKKTKKYSNIWPEINTDDKHYMPFFILSSDRDSLAKKEDEYRQAQIQRVKNALESKKEILVPHPGQSRHTCFVCKSHYNDYRTHIQTKAHKSKLRASRCQEMIHDLIAAVRQQNDPSFKPVQKEQKFDICRPTKKQINEEKLIQFQMDALSNFNDFDDGEDVEFQLIDLDAENDAYELKLKQPTEPSLNKNQENQTLLNCYMSNIQSFRVSDYLL